MKTSKIIHFYEFMSDVFIRCNGLDKFDFTLEDTGALFANANDIGMQINDGEFEPPFPYISLIKSMLFDDFLTELKKKP